MTTHTDTERLKAMEAAATKGPWECDTTHNEGSYGAGEDVYEGFKSYTILSEDGKVLFDSLNSDAIEVHEEYDEDGATAWDEIARRNAELIVAMRNALPALLARIERVEGERDSWKEQFHSAASAASEYSEFYERHHADFDAAGNYIPHSQIDGDLRAAETRSAALARALEEARPFVSQFEREVGWAELTEQEEDAHALLEKIDRLIPPVPR